MEQLPHVLLVGEGAACFAAEVGAETSELVTAEARQGWEKWLAENVPEEVRRAWPPRELAPWVRLTAGPALSHGTVNVLARDGAGHLATAVSTSGWPWKYPGRLGDSPIIGAGNYCDDRYGAATCTGVGEWAIRCGTARSVVLFQRLSYSLEAACRQAIRDLHRLDRRIAGNLNILALDREGHACGVTMASKPCPYTVWEEGMAGPETRQAEWIAIEEAR